MVIEEANFMSVIERTTSASRAHRREVRLSASDLTPVDPWPPTQGCDTLCGARDRGIGVVRPRSIARLSSTYPSRSRAPAGC